MKRWMSLVAPLRHAVMSELSHWMNSGRDLLAASFSGFDPNETL